MSTQQLTQEEIARVFAMYGSATFTESKGNMSGSGPAWYVVYKYVEDERNDLSPYKLLLTPLDRISDEDAIEVANFRGFGSKSCKLLDLGYQSSITIGNDIGSVQLFPYTDLHLSKYLISKGYAVPLFFAPNHLANGKTAIELGIAIDNIQTK